MLNKHISVNLMSNIYCNYFNTLKYVLLLPQPQPHPLRDGLQLSLWPRKVDVIIMAPGLERQWRTHHVSVESKSELFIIYLLPKMMCVQNTSLREGINNGRWKLLYKKKKKTCCNSSSNELGSKVTVCLLTRSILSWRVPFKNQCFVLVWTKNVVFIWQT